jgi:hypothetical protein
VGKAEVGRTRKCIGQTTDPLTLAAIAITAARRSRAQSLIISATLNEHVSTIRLIATVTYSAYQFVIACLLSKGCRKHIR